MRESNRWDAVINSVNYRLKRDEDGSPYRKVVGRSMLEIREILAQGGEQYLSRQDVRPMFQTSWSGGAQWQKPLLSEKSIDSYYVSEGFDLITEPGNIYPFPDTARVTVGTYLSTINIDPRTQPIQVAEDEIYYIGSSATGQSIIVKYNGSSYSTVAGVTSTKFVKACWDNANATIYVTETGANSKVLYVTPPSTSGTVLADIGTCYYGTNIFMHFGRLLVWTGEKLIEIGDPLGTPTQTTIYDDQMGPDMAEGVQTYVSTNPPAPSLAVSSAEGVWIVKNVMQEGASTPFIYRVDRTNDGSNIGVPVGTLPPGTIALNIAYHSGSLLIATATNTTALFDTYDPTVGYPQITFYHLTNDSLGTIGSPVGGRLNTDAPYVFLRNEKDAIYIGGYGSIWTYDLVRGGFHKVFDIASHGFFHGMAVTTDSSGDPIYQFNGDNLSGTISEVVQLPQTDEGGNTMTHTLESNYFDGNLPAEIKSVVGITLMADGIKANETWTVSIEADDAGSFTSAAVFDTDGAKTTYKALASAVTGYRFRYKIAWTATGDIASPSRVKGIIFHMVQGEMVTAWQLVIEGGEARNVENEVVRPEDTLSDLEVLAGKYQIIEYVDEFKETATTHDVWVDNVSIERKNANEIDRAVVVLTEQDLDN